MSCRFLLICILPCVFMVSCIESNPQPSPSSPGQIGRDDAFDRSQVSGDALEGLSEIVAAEDLTTPDTSSEEDVVADLNSTDTVADITTVDDLDASVELASEETWTGELVEDLGVDTTPGAMCDLCQPPYPACTFLQGQWVCVQCTEDSHCGDNCPCSQDTYSCQACSFPPPICSDNEECQEVNPAYLCDPDANRCYDPAGYCADFAASCNEMEGSMCVNMFQNDDIPPMPGQAKLCSCEEPAPFEDALACLTAGDCQAPDCFPGQVCLEFQVLCLSLFGDCPSLYDGPVCVGPTFLESLPVPF
jgi:hypothetical protein